MNTKYLILMGFLFFFSFCKQEEHYSFSDEQFVAILSDVHYAESVIQRAAQELKDSMITKYMDQIYQIHHITEAEYKRNLNLLKKDPKKMSAIYEKILADLKKKEAKNN